MTRRQAVSMGVDVGTSGCRAVVFSGGGRLLHSALASYPTCRTVAGEVTQDPDDWLRAVRQTLRECAVASEGRDVLVIGVTAPAHAAVLSDAEGVPLARSLMASDARPAAAAQQLKIDTGKRCSRRPSWTSLSVGPRARMSWLREQAPGLWPHIRWLLTQQDYIRFRLTGGLAITVAVNQRTRIFISCGPSTFSAGV